MNKKARGYSGESLAVQYLENKGYEIISRNRKIAGVEIDVLARYGEYYVFCEIKTREGDNYGTGLESVTTAQRRRYIRAAQFYLSQRGREEYSARFDVIEIMRDKINHVEDAFQG